MTTQAIAAIKAGGRAGGARGAIIDAAKKLFSERGYDGVSINDIARESTASKANIFHHFGSKERLYLAVIAHIVQRTRSLGDLPGDGGDILGQLQDMAAADLREGVEDEAGVRLILQEILSANPMRGRVLAEDIFSDGFSRIVGIVRAQQAEGRFRDDVDPAMAALVLRSATAFFLLGRNVLRHMPGVTFADDPEHFARTAVDLVLRGLIARNDVSEGTE